VSTPGLPRALRGFMLATDVGFVGYWLVTAAHLLPAAWLFKDYEDPILQSWNWSFLPLDLLISATGLTALGLARRGDGRATGLALVSLALTSTSGLMAVAFWTLRRDFDPAWWAPNLLLLLYPLAFLPRLLRAPPAPPRP
jgi:Family of unknown function (DUF5360)